MPAANLFSMKPLQRIMVKGIQEPMVNISVALGRPRRRIWLLFWLIKECIKIGWSLYKLPQPTKQNTNKHNVHVLLDINDWFLAHEDPKGPRYGFFKWFLNYVAQKYDWDGYMSRRLDAWLWQWKQQADNGNWIYTGKPPETYWKLTDEERQSATVKRIQALKVALHNGELDKALDFIE